MKSNPSFFQCTFFRVCLPLGASPRCTNERASQFEGYLLSVVTWDCFSRSSFAPLKLIGIEQRQQHLQSFFLLLRKNLALRLQICKKITVVLKSVGILHCCHSFQWPMVLIFAERNTFCSLHYQLRAKFCLCVLSEKVCE